MIEPSDDELLAMYRDGDAEAFDALFDRRRDSVYNFARFMLAGSADAEDALQEAFLIVARTAKDYQPRGVFKAWLMRITRNLCLNRLKSEQARRRALAEAGERPTNSSLDCSPPERAEADERMALLYKAISELPERQREAIVLRAFEQMSYGEIGESLDIPINTVKTLIHRGRAAIAEALEKV